ncbi:protein phosphatase 2C domain-containing protein [Streptomyces sp. NPDC048442]|uniref:PP2C family protein-serine/threonine phosphatase n=1 Tax=Streptomyces sp. NPDC048442 TaxID=3154823 RepID=UPI00342649C7
MHLATVWTERVPGRGEDAEPFAAHHLGTQQGLIAVFDGLGGSGSSPAWQSPGGEARTGAWVGSRVARLALDHWFHDAVAAGEPMTAQRFHEYLGYFLAHAPKRHSKIVGKMRRQLPTTLAAVRYKVGQGQLDLEAFWAGDSRAYVFSPDGGLRVLTRDHTDEDDTLELLRSDPPMTNVVSADRHFVIDSQQLSLGLPCVLLAATDGFFGYLTTPAEFECALLHTLTTSHSQRDWADQLSLAVQKYTADDASLAIVSLGYDSFDALRSSFTERHREVVDRYVRSKPRDFQQVELLRDWQNRTWQEYRSDYESYLPSLPEGSA